MHQGRCSGLELEQATHWNATEWPSLLGGWRQHHASVAVEQWLEEQLSPQPSVVSSSTSSSTSSIVVVLGGQVQDGSITDSVLVLEQPPSSTSSTSSSPSHSSSASAAASPPPPGSAASSSPLVWYKGPSLKDQRYGLAAVVVPAVPTKTSSLSSLSSSPLLFSIGGHTGSDILDTLEWITLTDLLQWRPPNSNHQRQGDTKQQGVEVVVEEDDDHDDDDHHPKKKIAATRTLGRPTTTGWTRLQTRLSSPRWGCAAVVVSPNNSSSCRHQYYYSTICVMGGNSGSNPLHSVDLVQVQVVQPQQPPPQQVVVGNAAIMGGGEHAASSSSSWSLQAVTVTVTITAGPSMNCARWYGGASTIEDPYHQHQPNKKNHTTTIFMVGGVDENGVRSNTVECLEFATSSVADEEAADDDDKTAVPTHTTPPMQWQWRPDLQLSNGLSGHAVVRIGSTACLAVAGGYNGHSALDLVEVLDPYRRVVWRLPHLTVPRYACSMVSLPSSSTLTTTTTGSSLLVLGGYGNSGAKSVESLSFVELSIPQLKQQARIAQSHYHAWTQRLHELDHPAAPKNRNQGEEDPNHDTTSRSITTDAFVVSNATTSRRQIVVVTPLEEPPVYHPTVAMGGRHPTPTQSSSTRRRRLVTNRRSQTPSSSSSSYQQTRTTTLAAAQQQQLQGQQSTRMTMPQTLQEQRLEFLQRQQASRDWYRRIQNRLHTLIFYYLTHCHKYQDVSSFRLYVKQQEQAGQQQQTAQQQQQQQTCEDRQQQQQQQEDNHVDCKPAAAVAKVTVASEADDR
ncbi:hypothetical protein ACA910_011178 [Epithemia clementina (nom. ined.)]